MDTRIGVIGKIVYEKFGVSVLGSAGLFPSLYVWSGVWQGLGFGSIIYIAAIANVNGDLHEAAAIDGANRWKRMWSVTFPSILPLIIVMFTMRIGLVFRQGFDKVLLLYMPATYEVSDCLYTYTYRMAFGQTVNYGLSTASGMFQSVIGSVLLIVSNKLSKKLAGTSMI
jgi:ABC-type polysaccharide transport system permease subunit